jgi:hypothetical protein
MASKIRSFIAPKDRRYIGRDKIANLLNLLEHRNSPGTSTGRIIICFLRNREKEIGHDDTCLVLQLVVSTTA